MTRQRAPGRDIRLLGMLWAQAENNVYPLALSRPDAYQRAVTAVRAMADLLREATTPADLVQAYDQAEVLVVDAARGSGTRIDDLDAVALAGAGFRLRYQEILAGSPPPAHGERAQCEQEQGRGRWQENGCGARSSTATRTSGRWTRGSSMT